MQNSKQKHKKVKSNIKYNQSGNQTKYCIEEDLLCIAVAN